MPIGDLEAAKQTADKIRQVVRFLKRSTADKAAALVMVAAFGTSAALGSLPKPVPLSFIDDSLWQNASRIGSSVFFLLSLGLLAWVARRLWGQLTPPAPADAEVKPSAIKGPMAFGPHDGPLFRRLGREEDIGTLLNHAMNDQISLVVVRGESGAGKTSLLRAGLASALESRSPRIEFHYWEAVPDDPEARLLVAIQDGWGLEPGGEVPQRLTDIFKRNAGPGRRVVVLDQFEQLALSNAAHRPIFDLLRHAAAVATPPYRTTLVVAFRSDYSSEWMDFQHGELKRELNAFVSVRLLTAAKAKDAMAVIAEADGFTVPEALADELIRNMRNGDGRVSPVDVGITLLALRERARTAPNGDLVWSTYRVADGSVGLLADYIESQLERFPYQDRSAILLALLHLADRDTNQRIAEGRTAQELADRVAFHQGNLERVLAGLAAPSVRLLEQTPTQGYRLQHERLIPALRRLSGVTLAEVDQAGRMLGQAYLDWANRGRRKGDLLRGRRLRDVRRHQRQIHWGSDRDGKEQFLALSIRRHNMARAATGLSVVILGALGLAGIQEFEKYQDKRDLEAWRQPVAVHAAQAQLTSLRLASSQATHLRWVRHCLRELSIRAPLLDRIEGLPECETTQSLVLWMPRSGATNLDALKGVRKLTKLELAPGPSITSLDALKNLKGLTSLTLYGSSSTRLDALKDLKGLTSLTLNLSGTSSANLDVLKDLRDLTSLTLYGSGITRLDALKDLRGLTSLTLNVSRGSTESLDALTNLKNLTSLTLNLRDSSIENLDALKNLKGLTSLTLDLFNSGITRLDALTELRDLTSLTLALLNSGTAGLDPLKYVKGLTSLTLKVSGTSVENLDPLKDLKSLTSLTLDLFNSDITRLDPLKDLKGLTSLVVNVSDSGIRKLDDLKDLKALTSLSLNVARSSIESLDALKDLRNLTSLALNVSSTAIAHLDALKDLEKLTSLTLHGSSNTKLDALQDLKGLVSLTLYGSSIPSLDALRNLKGLTSLTLNVSDSSIANLDELKELTSLTSLTLNVSRSSIDSLDALKDLKNLISLTLNLSGTKINDLGSLKEMGRLTKLSLVHDRVYVLSNLPTSVVHLDISDGPNETGF